MTGGLCDVCIWIVGSFLWCSEVSFGGVNFG